MSKAQSRTVEILKKGEADILQEWLADLKAAGWGSDGRISESESQSQAREFLQILGRAARGDMPDIDAPDAAPLRHFLETLSRSLATQGYTSAQTATFVFSLKKPIFARLRKELGSNAEQLAEETWAATELFDKLGMFTVQTYQKSREEI